MYCYLIPSFRAYGLYNAYLITQGEGDLSISFALRYIEDVLNFKCYSSFAGMQKISGLCV